VNGHQSKDHHEKKKGGEGLVRGGGRRGEAGKTRGVLRELLGLEKIEKTAKKKTPVESKEEGGTSTVHRGG